MTKSEQNRAANAARPVRLAAVAAGTLRRAWVLALATGLVIAGAVAAALLPPLALEGIVNRLAGGEAVGWGLALGYFGLLAAAGALESAQSVCITVFGQRITRDLRDAMCQKLARLPAAYFSGHEPGWLTSRFTNDVDTVETLFDEGIVSMFADGCKVVGIVAVIFTRSRGLGVLLAVVTPLLFGLTRWFQKRMLAAQLANRAAIARVNGCMPETIRNIRMIHAFCRERYMEARYDKGLQQSYRSTEKTNLYDSVYSPIVVFTGAAVVAVMMVLSARGGGMQQWFGMSVGASVAVIAYVGKVFGPLESIGMEIENIQSAVAGVRRINEFLAEPERPAPDLPLPDAARTGPGAPAAAALADVTFGYDPARPVLRHFSLAVAPGESVTLVGRTGAGKSTVFRLLLGEYLPAAGEVRVFGAPAHRIRDAEKRWLFGYVAQQFAPVAGTVGEQISLFDPALGPDAVRRAAALVGLDGVIGALPQGYATPYADGLFSQGQKQLLSIARAVAADPPLLLLDEITASLDSGTEQLVLSALSRAAQNRTVLSISHRLYEQDARTRRVAL